MCLINYKEKVLKKDLRVWKMVTVIDGVEYAGTVVNSVFWKPTNVLSRQPLRNGRNTALKCPAMISHLKAYKGGGYYDEQGLIAFSCTGLSRNGLKEIDFSGWSRASSRILRYIIPAGTKILTGRYKQYSKMISTPVLINPRGM